MRFQYFQNRHNNLDGEVTIQYAQDPMCSGQALYRNARFQERGLCLSISRHPRAQLCNIPQDYSRNGGNRDGEGPRKMWTGTWSWHSWISSLINNALQDQGVMPLLIHTAVGPSTGKSGERCPFRVLRAQWEDVLTASERPKAQQRMDTDSWQKGLAYLSSELHGRELSLSKLVWGWQTPRPLLVHGRKAVMMACCCCRVGMSSPQGTLYVPIPAPKFWRYFEHPKSKL